MTRKAKVALPTAPLDSKQVSTVGGGFGAGHSNDGVADNPNGGS